MTAIHPSFFELDVFAVAPVEGEVSRHVRECQQCSAHLAAVRMPSPFPAALAHLDAPVSATPKLPRWLLFAVPLAAVLMLTVATVGLVRFMKPSDEWTSKGLPAASLWLKRGETVTAWKKGELLPRDASVRWEIAPAGFTHLRVIDPQSNEVLLEKTVPGDAPVFTPAWTFDGKRSTERIRVVLTRNGDPLPEDWKCNEGLSPAAPAWCSEYVLEVAADDQVEPR